jgi:xylulose-5-phosphate/fructose-6-phosphate phosphoketolase
MVVLNQMSRYHLCIEAIRRAPTLSQEADGYISELERLIQHSEAYARQHFEDPPEIAGWTWGGRSQS